MKAKLNAKVYRGPRSGTVSSFKSRELFASLSFEVKRTGKSGRLVNLPDGLTLDKVRKRADRSILRELIKRGFRVFTQLELFTDHQEVTLGRKDRLTPGRIVAPCPFQPEEEVASCESLPIAPAPAECKDTTTLFDELMDGFRAGGPWPFVWDGTSEEANQ